MKRSLHNITMGGKAFSDGKVNATLINVGNSHCRATRLPGHGSREKSNSSGAKYKSCRARGWLCPVDCMEGNREGFEQGC